MSKGDCGRCGGTGIYRQRFHNQPTDKCYACGGSGYAPPLGETIDEVSKRTIRQRYGDGSTLMEPATPEHVNGPPEVIQALDAWRGSFGNDSYRHLARLRAVEPDRYKKAVASIVNGRGSDVAAALRVWYETG